MKLLHISDLHLGKRLREISLLKDQEHILNQILDITDTEHPDCVMIAGDVYDKSVPPAEAVVLFDWFISSLSERKLPVFIISGNHDSPERIAFGSRIMRNHGVHVSPVYDGKIEPVTLYDAYGAVHFYMLPFIRPNNVRRCFLDKEIKTYTDAADTAIEAMQVDYTERNVLIAHQFVTGASCCDSEEISVGGTENIDASVFDGFDYIALGHIHNPQNIGDPCLRYCGTPLKYSFSEVNQEKSVTIAELGKKQSLQIRTIPLVPLHEMREIRGMFEEVSKEAFSEDYLHIILTDEEDVPDALGKLRMKFPNLLHLEYDNTRTRTASGWEESCDVKQKTPLELFSEFYEFRNGQPMNAAQQALMEEIIRNIWEDEQ